MIELTHNWDAHAYELGTGYGHIAIEVADVYEACDELKSRAPRSRAGRPDEAGGRVIAFVEDPDGYKIELIQRA